MKIVTIVIIGLFYTVGSTKKDKFGCEVGSRVKACSLLNTITIQYNHEHTVTSSSVRFLLQSYKYIGFGGLQITATRLPQNVPNRIWSSKNSPEVIPPSRIGKVQRWQPYRPVDHTHSRCNSRTVQGPSSWQFMCSKVHCTLL